MPFLHCISSFDGTSPYLLLIEPIFYVFLLLLAFTSADIIFHKLLELHSTFIWKKDFRHEFSFLNRFTNTPLTPRVIVLKDHSHHLTKYEGKGARVLIFKLFIELGKIWKCNLGFSKTPISHLFLWIGKNLETYKALDQHFKIEMLNLWMSWENLCPNLSFTFENKWEISVKEDGNISNLTLVIEIFHSLKF